MSDGIQRLLGAYPWLKAPVVVSAPMRLLALAELSVEVSKAGGFGFIGAGYDPTRVDGLLERARQLLEGSSLRAREGCMPVGVGFINWGMPLATALRLLEKYRPAAVWLFAPEDISDLDIWCKEIKRVTRESTQIWVQVGTVAEACAVAGYGADVLVVQGCDAGGHGLNTSASLMTLLPEVADAVRSRSLRTQSAMPVIVAAGGIMDGRGAAAAQALGASGVVLGTRLLAAHEANIADGYRNAVLQARDGGARTVRTDVYDQLRGAIGWPKRYGGRGVINRSFVDAQAGMALDENLRLYREAEQRGDDGWGVEGRMTTYAGTGVGLVTRSQSASQIVEEVRDRARTIIRNGYAHGKL